MDTTESTRILINTARFFSVMVCLSLIFVACDQPFQPVADDDNFTFSIYGYLDASADTQWVRITPARKQRAAFGEVPEMHVTLTHLESGNAVVMNDSLLRFRQGFNVINSWTTMDIEPEESYTLRAEGPDGSESHVTVTIPPDFPTPVLQANAQSLSGELLIEGVERIADVQTLWKENGRVPYRRFVEQSEVSENRYFVPLRIGWDLQYLFGDRQPSNLLDLGPRQIFVASGGPGWNEGIPSLSDLEYATLEGTSNVEGGVGYVIGIVSKTIPFKGCFNDEGENIACPTEEPFF